MRSSLIVAAASLVLTLAPFVAQAAAPFEGVVAFGDSLSDAGNVFVATGAFEVRPFEPIPDAPYLIGGFRFTNGPTWIEWLTRPLRQHESRRPGAGCRRRAAPERSAASSSRSGWAATLPLAEPRCLRTTFVAHARDHRNPIFPHDGNRKEAMRVPQRLPLSPTLATY